MAQRTIPIAAGRLDGALDANSKKIINLATPTANSDAATKQYVDEHGGGGGGGAIDDVKVDGTSVVTNRVANIDLTGKASVSSLNAEVNRATAVEATKASAASLTAETNRATAAEALKRDKTDMTIPAGYDVTIPAGSQKNDKSKYTYEWWDEDEPTGYIVYYDGGRLGFGAAGNQHDDFTVVDDDEGLTYSFTWVSADTIAKTSEVNAGLATKYTKPSGGIPKADLASGVQTSLGKADSAVQSGDMVVAIREHNWSSVAHETVLRKKWDRSFGYNPWVVTIPSTSTKTDRSKWSIEYDGGGDAWEIYYDEVYSASIYVASTTLSLSWTDAEDGLSYSAIRTIDNLALNSEVDSKILADKTHAKSISVSGISPITPNASTGNIDVSSLFSGDNTSYAGTAMPISAGVISASNPSIKDYVDAQVGTIETALSEV